MKDIKLEKTLGLKGKKLTININHSRINKKKSSILSKRPVLVITKNDKEALKSDNIQHRENIQTKSNNKNQILSLLNLAKNNSFLCNDKNSKIKNLNMIEKRKFLHQNQYSSSIQKNQTKKDNICNNKNINILKANSTTNNQQQLVCRAPIVAIMGHVDHGKTTLLDRLRTTNTASLEHGGITQHIGAYQIDSNTENAITFLDTPGHESFIHMRERGANITDIIIIVIAADDGIKEQTIESINHAKKSTATIIIAITKVDKKQIDRKKITSDLLQYNVVTEEMGGNIPVISISSIKDIGIDKLKKMILLKSKTLKLQIDISHPANGSIIESKMNKKSGIHITIIPKNGILKVGDTIMIGNDYCKIRSLTNDQGIKIPQALPSMPVQVTGLSKIPAIGSDFKKIDTKKISRKLVSFKGKKSLSIQSCQEEINLNSIFLKKKTLSLLIKADVQGSLEAIVSNVIKFNNEDVIIKVIKSEIGEVTKSDINFANIANAKIIVFNVKVNTHIKELGEKDGINIQEYNVIYKLLDEIKKSVQMLMPIVKQETIIGKAEVRDIFDMTKQGKIIGCMVKSGYINNKSMIRIINNKSIIYNGVISSLKRFKNDIKEVKAGFECGISIKKSHNIKKGDTIEVYETTEQRKSIK